MAEDDDNEVPIGARTMQVDAVADALDVLDEQGADAEGADDIAPPVLPPALPPPLPSRKKHLPVVAMIIAGVVAVGAAVLVSQLMSPTETEATEASPDESDGSGGSQIDLGPILVQASDEGDAAGDDDGGAEETAEENASP